MANKDPQNPGGYISPLDLAPLKPGTQQTGGQVYVPPAPRIDVSQRQSERTDQGPSYTTTVTPGPNGQLYQVTYDPTTGRIVGSPIAATPEQQAAYNAAHPSGGGTSGGGGYTSATGGGTAMTAYEAAQVALDKQRIADAEAQRLADEQYRQSQALETSNKDFQDYQSKHYYGSLNGPAYAPPAGAASFYQLPEPTDLKAAYANSAVNTTGQVDPWAQKTPAFSGYSGTNFNNPQQPGVDANSTAIPQGAVPAPIPQPTTATPVPLPKGMAGGGMGTKTPQLAVLHGGEDVQDPSMDSKVPGPPGQPQLGVLNKGDQVQPGGNFDLNNPTNPPSPVANQGPEKMNPLIQALLSAVNGIITSPDFRSAVYSQGQPGGSGLPPGMATGGTVDQQTTSPNPWKGSNVLNQSTSDIVSGPTAINHIPYGPELTGASGFGGLISANGTPVPMSQWQRTQLDPTSIARYNDYASSIAGVDPQDLQQIGTLETGNKMADLVAPKKFQTAAIPISALSVGGG